MSPSARPGCEIHVFVAQIAAGHFQDLARDLCLPLGLLRSATTTQIGQVRLHDAPTL